MTDEQVHDALESTGIILLKCASRHPLLLERTGSKSCELATLGSGCRGSRNPLGQFLLLGSTMFHLYSSRVPRVDRLSLEIWRI